MSVAELIDKKCCPPNNMTTIQNYGLAEILHAMNFIDSCKSWPIS